MTEQPPHVSFARDIRPLFRPLDFAHMLPFGVRLGDHDYMCDPADNFKHATDVGDFLSGARQPRMPPGGPFWTAAQLALYAHWISDGCPP